MASTYVNDLRLNEMATGDASGTWGTNTNTNLELIAEAFSYGSEAIADASTHTITIADGSTDEARSFYLKCTGGGQACTVTLAPNTVSKVWIIENATSYTLTFSQGSSGANVAVPAGQVKMIATDGGGASAGIVYDLLTDVDLAGTTTAATLTASGTVTAATLTASGVITGSTVEATGDTSAGDNAAMGYTAAEGLILTGQGSTNDVTIKNDADADVIEIPTGTTNVTVAGTLGTGGAITSGAGLLIADAGTIGSASDTDAVAISSAGQVSFSATNAIKIPVGTTAQRPSNAAGLIRYNSTLGQFEGYTSAWGGLGGGATGGGADQVFVENSDDVTTNYTITSGKNAMSVGPITVESGVVVTIPSGSRWVVL